MSYPSMIKVVGVVLFGFWFYHLTGSPWFLVPTAGIACLFLP